MLHKCEFKLISCLTLSPTLSTMIPRIFVTYMLSRVLSHTLFNLFPATSTWFQGTLLSLIHRSCALKCVWGVWGRVKISSEMSFLECRSQKDPGLALMTFYQWLFAAALINVLKRLLRRIDRELLGQQSRKLFTCYFRALRNSWPLCCLQRFAFDLAPSSGTF